MKSTQMRHIAVSENRLKEAIVHGVQKSVGTSFNEIISEEVQDVTVQTALVKKVYIHKNKLELRLTDSNEDVVEATLNYPFLSKNIMMTFLPNGDLVSEDNEEFVVPSDLYCNVMKYHKDTDDEYLVIGFIDSKGETVANECFKGNIIIKNGFNKITLSEDNIVLNCVDLIINGVSWNNTLEKIEKKQEDKNVAK